MVVPVLLALRGLWSCHCFRCWSSQRCGCPSREAIADDQVQWFWVVRVGLLLLHEQELEKLILQLCHVKLVERGACWLFCKAVNGRQLS